MQDRNGLPELEGRSHRGVHFRNRLTGLANAGTEKENNQGMLSNRGNRFILCILDRAPRKVWAEGLSTRSAGETKDAVLEMRRDAGARETIKELCMDSASGF